VSIHGGNLESSDTNWGTRRVTDIYDDDHEYKSIPTSQLSAITSPSTYNGRSDLTPECRISRIKAKSDDLRVSIVTTSFLPIERSAPISVCVYTYSSSILEEAHFQKHFSYTYGYTTRAMNRNGGGPVYQSSTLTATNVCTSEVHLRRRHPKIKRTYSGDTLRSVKCIYGQRPTQFRRPYTTTTTTMTTMTMMSSEHKYYGQLNRQ
jgi:hypothetical protein